MRSTFLQYFSFFPVCSHIYRGTYLTRLLIRRGHVKTFVSLWRVVPVGVLEDEPDTVSRFDRLRAHQAPVKVLLERDERLRWRN